MQYDTSCKLNYLIYHHDTRSLESLMMVYDLVNYSDSEQNVKRDVTVNNLVESEYCLITQE